MPVKRFRELSIGRKLALSYLAFFIPLAVLVFFMDISFAFDINIGRSELDGTRYLRAVGALAHEIPHHWIESQTEDSSLEMSIDAYEERIDGLFSELMSVHRELEEPLELDQASLAAANLSEIHPAQIETSWRLYGRQRSEQSFRSIVGRLHELRNYVADTSFLTQDPALDSNALVRAVVLDLSAFDYLVADNLLHSVYMRETNPQQRVFGMLGTPLQPNLTDTFAFEEAADHFRVALREDAETYGRTDVLHDDVLPAWNAFERAAVNYDRFVNEHAEMDGNGVPWAEYIQAGMQVRMASRRFAELGTDAIDQMVQQRLNAFWRWRILAFSASFLAVGLIALFVYVINHGVNQSLRSFLAFTEQAARGATAAEPDSPLSGEMDLVYRHVKAMLGRIETLVAFPRENPYPVMGADRDGTIVYRNGACDAFVEGNPERHPLPEQHLELVRDSFADGGTQHELEQNFHGRVLRWFYHPVPDLNRVHIYVRDVTEERRVQAQLAHDAMHDKLTGLPNKMLFRDRLEQAIRSASSRHATRFAVCIIDLDRFKLVNESLGHGVGDKLIAAVADRLRSSLRPDDTLARFGGDEFAVLLDDLESTRDALHTAERMNKILNGSFSVEGYEIRTTASIGVVLSSNRELEAESIIRDADTAMYRAKSEGRDRYEIFDGSMYDSALRGFRLEMDLRKAIERHEFFVEYQPIIALTDGRVAGFEALVRWEHPELGRISPGDFVPVAEETGLIVALGEWVMDRAVDQAARWQREFSHRGELIMSVNLAARQFRHRSLVSDIKHCLDSSGLAASRLKLEITESSLIEDPGESMGLMQELKQLGTRLSIDDFGTGYSSLSYLHRFPFDMLKVDRSFVTGMTESEDSRKIVTNIISLAQNLEKVCISEGVEKASEADYLRSLGCEFAQGFLYSQALPAGKAASMLETSPVFSRSGTAAT